MRRENDHCARNLPIGAGSVDTELGLAPAAGALEAAIRLL
jgi:hypothetical protein